jgi:hypothetical protein
MIFRIFFIFYFFSSVALADDSNASELLNKVLKKNYHFIEKSLDQSELKIGTSSGKIFHDDSGMTVKVLAPFEENYRLEGEFIEIHDLFLDQKQRVSIKEINSFFLNLLTDGVDSNSKNYKINYVNDALIEIIPNDGSSSINFFFKNDNLALIRYKDSIGIEHGIELTQI